MTGREAQRYPPGEAGELSRPTHLRMPNVLSGVRVLVVDDDVDTADLFAVALGACGAEVVAATSAADAMRLLAGGTPDVVVTDIAMPGGDGYWLLGEIRRMPHPRAQALPVLAVTAFARDRVRDRALAAGFADHLEKPIDPESLCRAVARILGR